MNDVSHLSAFGNLLRVLQSDLQTVILHILLRGNDFLFRVNQEITGFPVNLHLHVVRLSKMVLARGKQGSFNGVEEGFLADLLLLLQNIQCFHQFLIHDYLHLLKI